MVEPGDKIWVTKRDGAEKAGWAVWTRDGTRPLFGLFNVTRDGFYEFFATSCGLPYSAEDLFYDIKSHYCTSGVSGVGMASREVWFEKPDPMPNYLCMAEQLIATGELPGLGD